MVMKIKPFLITTLFFLCSITSSSHANNNDAVTLTTHNLFPYGSYPEGKSQPQIATEHFQGVAVDVVRCAFQALDTPLIIKVLPWKRAQIDVKRNTADGFFAASQKDSRDQYALMSEYIAEQTWNWYLLKENPLSPDSDDFKTKAKVGAFQGSNMLSWLQAEHYQVSAKPVTSEGLLEMLLLKRVDAIMANNYVMQALLEKHSATLRIVSYTHKNKPLAVYFSQYFLSSRPDFLDAFNQAVKACRKDKS